MTISILSYLQLRNLSLIARTCVDLWGKTSLLYINKRSILQLLLMLTKTVSYADGREEVE